MDGICAIRPSATKFRSLANLEGAAETAGQGQESLPSDCRQEKAVDAVGAGWGPANTASDVATEAVERCAAACPRQDSARTHQDGATAEVAIVAGNRVWEVSCSSAAKGEVAADSASSTAAAAAVHQERKCSAVVRVVAGAKATVATLMMPSDSDDDALDSKDNDVVLDRLNDRHRQNSRARQKNQNHLSWGAVSATRSQSGGTASHYLVPTLGSQEMVVAGRAVPLAAAQTRCELANDYLAAGIVAGSMGIACEVDAGMADTACMVWATKEQSHCVVASENTDPGTGGLSHFLRYLQNYHRPCSNSGRSQA